MVTVTTEFQRQTDMFGIKKKITEIHRAGKRPVIRNYYLNCEQDEEIFALFGNETVVFWDNDRGVIRVYFYSVCPEELIEMLKQIPDGAIVDYLTRTEGEYSDIFSAAGLTLKYEMMRMSTYKLTKEEREELDARRRLYEETLYMKDNVRAATEADLEVLYKKLYEVFDARESHLCTREELLQFIRNRWVAVYYEEEELKGFQIFTVKANQFYGYQIWNSVGPEGYYSLDRMVGTLFAECVKDVPKEKQKPSYCWVNRHNRKSYRLLTFWGNKFDGLYDFVYEK